MSDFKLIDKTAKTWYVHTGAFPLPHGTRPDLTFMPGVKYQVDLDKWMEGQPTLKLTDMEEEVEIQKPEQPKLPRVDKPHKG